MKQLLYKIIYNKNVNYILRNVNKAISGVLPKKVKLPPSGTLNLKLSKNKSLIFQTNQTNYLTQLLFWNGYLKFEYTPIFLKLVKKTSTFYDIGANIGYYSLLAAAHNDRIKVVGFEPALGPLHYFKKNVAANGYATKIKIEPIALSDGEGEIEFHETKSKKYQYLEHNLAGDGSAIKDEGGNFITRKVQTLTLDDYVRQSNETNIDLIKMDTEGTEHLILKSAAYVLAEYKPVIICETLFNTTESQLEEIMVAHGYEFYSHVGDGLEKVTTLLREKDNGVRNCFFVHPSKYQYIEEFVLRQASPV